MWLSLVAMLLSVTMVNIGIAGIPQAKLSIDPTRLPEKSGTLGHPGDEYIVSINIEKVQGLYAAGFTVKYAPYVSVLVASDVQEGPFLEQGGNTVFLYTINAFKGEVKVGMTLLGAPAGVSGEGTLATLKFTVREAGESPIELVDVYLFDINGDLMGVDSWDSFYYGPTADLVRATLAEGRVISVSSSSATFENVLRNDGDVTLKVRTRFDLERMEDGRRVTIYAGQNYAGGGLGEPLPYDYIYLDEFNEWYYEWNNPATNALGTPDGSYIEGDANAQWASLYSFEDISLAGREIAYIEIEGYSQYPNGATEGADIDLYAFTSVQGFAWLGSNYGTATWGWHGVRWTADKVTDVCPELRDEATLNGMELMFYDYYGVAPDIMRVDSCRLKISWSPITPVVVPTYDLEPYVGPTEFDPMTIAEVTTDMIGSYTCTATCEYTLEGIVWNAGDKVRTFNFRIVP